ncbi:cell division protein ZipA [Pseudidiomarina tainanensis]|uniref:Cell division protein ZipA n=2 Tax=Pseudidiomarina TaxID=2800384 RepID=A0A1I6G463_9GAMM|nr:MULTISPECIES: cell division protein ZipA [Pseudidiomarina]RZQ57184.1 cell division protein ZipA [Pseudidiomarina tainanensis]SFR36985.1 cell division protein ZipA [Pseudidiomarina maritima]
MSTMQIVFSIIGLVLIAAIVGHGVWTIRKNEKRQQEQAAAVEQKRQRASSSDFDDDGIGEVRVVKRTPSATPANPSVSAAEQSVDTTKVSNDKPKAEQAPAVAPTIRATDEEPELDLPEVTVDDEEVKARAVAAKPAPQQADKKDISPQPAQQSMDLPLERDDDEPIITEEPEEVIVLHVTGNIEGAILLQQMTELGFKFGDFDIFHRHVDTAGNGPVLFSLANMFNPGSFNIDTIETFQTEGVALFLALPIKSNSLQAFNMMHNAAVKLAAAVSRGHVLDEHRNPLTRQAVQHIHQRIREFERKRLIKQN